MTVLKKQKLDQVVGLDIGTYSLKLVESAIRNENAEIERALSVPIPAEIDRSNPDSLGKWIAEIWKSEKIKTKTVRLILNTAMNQLGNCLESGILTFHAVINC